MAKMQYAGFWLRFAAYFIDCLLLWAMALILIIPLIITIFSHNDYELAEPALALQIFGYFFAVILFIIIARWLYEAFMESSRFQGTLGKMAVGIIVTDERGGHISFARATGRHFAKILSGILFIGYIMAAFTEKKQGLHDMIAETLVLKR
jgi:uncharacterized RDD family membrane protein YckC